MHRLGNINLQHHFKENEIIDINLDYLNYSNNNPSSYIMESNNFDNNEMFEEIDIKKSTPITIYVGALDYTLQITPKLKFEAGLKGTLSKFKNDFEVNYLNSGIWTTDTDLTNVYWLNENISAAYSSLNYNINDRTSLAAGLRYEYLNSVMNSETEQGVVDLHYGEFFPTLYLSRQLNNRNKLQFSCNKRITRPAYNELAPFILMISPESYIKGNEKLLPAISNMIKMDYQHKNMILSISYTDTENDISVNQPIYDEKTEKMFYTSQNMDNQKTTAVMFTFPVKVTNWWKMQNNVNWIKQKVETLYDDNNINLDQNNYRINSTQSFSINKKLSAEISGFYQSKSLFGILERKPYGRLDIGCMYKFKNENSKLNLTLTDVFLTNTRRWGTDNEDLNYASSFKYVLESRVARISFTHNFGKTATKARSRKTGSEDESNRISF